MVGAGEGLVGVGELSTTKAAGSGVNDGSAVRVGRGVKVVVTSTTKGLGWVGVSDGTTAGMGVDVDVTGAPPIGVGVRYCPHRDASPTQDAVIKETAINKAESRLTFRPFRELYLY
jgi:hypothetical protein